MALTNTEIRTAALELDPAEREALATELLLSLSGAQQDEIDAAWLAEAKARETAFLAGKITARPVDEALVRLSRPRRRSFNLPATMTEYDA